MTTATPTKKLLIATTNLGKFKEFSHILTPLGFSLSHLGDGNYPAIAETGQTFIENALIKARAASTMAQSAALADDSGLCVPALDGKPGIYSARFSGEHATSADNIQKLLHDMQSLKNKQRQAYFYCALVFMRHPEDPCPIITTGQWRGTILSKPQGDDGFGYDPIFFIPEKNQTAAMLTVCEKNRISHRGQALIAMQDQLVTSSIHHQIF